MKQSVPLAFLAFLLAAAPGHAAPEPTPTPGSKPARKLAGGSFGLSPSTSPTAGASDRNSLAGAARKTQEKADAAGQAPSRGIVITNESLRPGSSIPPARSTEVSGSSKKKPTPKVSPTPTPGIVTIPEYRDSSGRTEADWRKRATIARERIERAEADLPVARENVKRLENDFYAWSDGNYRERVIRPAWDQAREKQRLLETEVDAARAGLADLEEEARKSGTPPGWLR